MYEVLAQLGVGGGFAVLILIVVFGFLKVRKHPGEVALECPNKIEHLSGTLLSIENKTAEIGATVLELYKWHCPNSDGIQNWKFGKVLEEKFQRMLDSLDELKILNRRLASQAEDQTSSLKTMTAALQKAIDNAN